MFGDEGAKPLLGVTALESAGIEVDPQNQRLIAWDAEKEHANVEKHRVDFPETLTVFGDPFECTGPDPDHSFKEHPFLSLGASSRNRVLVVSYTEHSENRVRSSGAWLASRRERRDYEPGA